MADELYKGDKFPSPDEKRLLREKAHEIIFLARSRVVTDEQDQYKFLKEGSEDLYHLEYIIGTDAIDEDSDLARMYVESLRVIYTPEHYDPEDEVGKNGVDEEVAVYVAYLDGRYVHYLIKGNESSVDIMTPDTEITDEHADRPARQQEALELRTVLQAALAHDT